MKFYGTIKVALRQLQINRTRTVFAVIALSIGIAAVITMTAIGNGAKAETVRQFEELGTNLITVNAGKITRVMQRKDSSDRITTLRMRDCDVILDRCDGVREAVPSIAGNVKVKYGNTASLCMVNGVTPPYFRIRNFQIRSGELFTQTDNKFSHRVAVLGSQVSQSLFGNADPVGEIILIGRVPFRVTGVLKAKGVNAEGANLDVQVLIPVMTALRRVFNADYLDRIFVEVDNRSLMKKTETEIISALRDYHRLGIMGKENDFTIDNQLTAIQTAESSSRSFTWLIVGVSALALIVGGIGILAVMLLSVRIRNSEIGLRLSVGAKRTDIVQQFMAESAILGLAGGIAGILAGLTGSGIMALVSSWHIAVSPASVFASLLFSVVTGLIFGVIPARKASQANPITAIQKE